MKVGLVVAVIGGGIFKRGYNSIVGGGRLKEFIT